MADKFLGAWLVMEYVFAPAGSYLGHIRQRRELLQLESGAIRVVQHCQPEDSLADHAMGLFTGEWVFDLTVAGRQRLYHGPAVVGSGRTWGDGVMYGEGLWPDFGHNFHSFSVLANPERQLTGGKFYNANEMVANIVGVAIPETPEANWPELALAPGPPVGQWVGIGSIVEASGDLSDGLEMTRTVDGQAARERHPESGTPVMALDWKMAGERFKVSGTGPAGQPWQGLAKQYGPMRESILYGQPGHSLEQMDIYDANQATAITLRRWYKNHAVTHVQAIRWQLGDPE